MPLSTAPTLMRPPGGGWDRAHSGLFVPPGLAPQQRRPIAVGLFAGAGGFDLGLTMAGYHVAAAVELDKWAAQTYLTNLGGPATVVHTHGGVATDADPEGRFGTGWISGAGHTRCPGHPHGPHGMTEADPDGPRCAQGCGWSPEGCNCVRCLAPWPCEHFWLDDIRRIAGAEILTALGLGVGELDAIIGGPPCQGYSAAGRRDVMDPRNSLVFEMARIIRETRPKAFILENVPGILSMVTPDGIPVVDAFCRQLADADYGDYQTLRRSLLAHADAGVGTPYQPRTDNDGAPRRGRRRADVITQQLGLFGEA